MAILFLNADKPLPVEDYTICHKEYGITQIKFTLPVESAEYKEIDEETPLYETTEGLYYLVKAIDADDDSADVVAQLDMTDWKGVILGSWASFVVHEQPKRVRGVSGASGTMSVTVTGATDSYTISYQWQFTDDDVDWHDVSGATGSSLTVYVNETTDGRKYRCKIRDSIGDVEYSDEADIDMVTSEADEDDDSETEDEDTLPDVRHRPWIYSHSSEGEPNPRRMSTMLGAICNRAGWTYAIRSDCTEDTKTYAALEMEAPTPLEVAETLQETFGVRFVYDNRNKVVTVVYPSQVPLSNGFIRRSVNAQQISYTGKSDELVTRLYCEGKDGLTIESVNSGLPYIDNNEWTSKIICGYWSDSSIDDAQQLLYAGKEQLEQMAVPERSWEVEASDLYKHDPTMWDGMGLDQWTRIRLIDDKKGANVTVQIVEDEIHSNYADKNKYTISTYTRSIQRTTAALRKQINDKNSSFWREINRRVGK